MDDLFTIIARIADHVGGDPDHPNSCPFLDEEMRKIRHLLTPEQRLAFISAAIELSRF